jgi:hypothetical protein
MTTIKAAAKKFSMLQKCAEPRGNFDPQTAARYRACRKGTVADWN